MRLLRLIMVLVTCSVFVSCDWNDDADPSVIFLPTPGGAFKSAKANLSGFANKLLAEGYTVVNYNFSNRVASGDLIVLLKKDDEFVLLNTYSFDSSYSFDSIAKKLSVDDSGEDVAYVGDFSAGGYTFKQYRRQLANSTLGSVSILKSMAGPPEKFIRDICITIDSDESFFAVYSDTEIDKSNSTYSVGHFENCRKLIEDTISNSASSDFKFSIDQDKYADSIDHLDLGAVELDCEIDDVFYYVYGSSSTLGYDYGCKSLGVELVIVFDEEGMCRNVCGNEGNISAVYGSVQKHGGADVCVGEYRAYSISAPVPSESVSNAAYFATDDYTVTIKATAGLDGSTIDKVVNNLTWSDVQDFIPDAVCRVDY